MRPQISLLITDLDNTLYDWVSAFVPAFYAMVEDATKILDVQKEDLLNQLKEVHQKHGDAEHPFALLETRAVLEKYPRASRSELIQAVDPAFHAFNKVRKERLKLYDGVRETLAYLNDVGISVVAYTDARVINCIFRLERLGIRGLISRLYAPAHLDKELDHTQLGDFVRLLPTTDRKPNPKTLIDICSEYGVAPSETVYVGDSLVRDVYMAKRAGVVSAWAKFGTDYDADLWPQLVRVTHWTDEDVSKEKALRQQAQGVEPDFVLETFADVTRLFGFSKTGSSNARVYFLPR